MIEKTTIKLIYLEDKNSLMVQVTKVNPDETLSVSRSEAIHQMEWALVDLLDSRGCKNFFTMLESKINSVLEKVEAAQ